MNLYIKVKDGQPVNHPAFHDNLIAAFKKIPMDWELFERVPMPEVGIYQILESQQPTYEKIDGVWKDVWPLRDMTNEEKLAKQQKVKDAWAARDQAQNWSAWIFNEDKCEYEPPTPRPPFEEGKIIFWSGADNNWKEAPACPQDGNNYKFNFLDWVWVLDGEANG